MSKSSFSYRHLVVSFSPLSSGIARFHTLAGHNLGLPIWFDSRSKMELCSPQAYCSTDTHSSKVSCILFVHCNLLNTTDACRYSTTICKTIGSGAAGKTLALSGFQSLYQLSSTKLLIMNGCLCTYTCGMHATTVSSMAFTR